MVGVDIKGFNDVPEHLGDILDKKRQAAFMEQLVHAMASLIRQYAPRDTHESHVKSHPKLPHLEDSIEVVKLSDTEYQIKIKVPYAKYLEFGTRYIDIGTVNVPKAVISGSGKQSFRPFVRPAIWQMYRANQDLIKKVFFEK